MYQEAPQDAIAHAIDFIVDAGYDLDYQRVRHLPNLLAIRYEDFFGGRESCLVKFLADQLGHPITDRKAKEIHQKNSLNRNKERASEVKDFTTWDENSLIHGNHVSNEGKVGGWKDVFSLETAKVFEKKLGHSLRVLQYEGNGEWVNGQKRSQ